MGIVQKQKNQIDNLEAKNRMLKRMYENQRAEALKANAKEAAAEYLLVAAVLKQDGHMTVTQEDLEEAKHTDVVARILEDGSVEYIKRDLITE